MSKPRLAIFCHNLEINGANVFAGNLIQALNGLGFSITVLSFRDGAFRQRLAPLCDKVEILPADFDSTLLFDYSLVIVNTLFGSRIVRECHYLGVPHFMVVHETWPPEQLGYYLREIWSVEGVSEAEVLQALRVAQHVVFAAKYLSGVYRSLVGSERSSSIYCSIETSKIDAYLQSHDRATMRQELGIANDALFFVQMGTVTKRKAQLTTVKAFARLRLSGAVKTDMRLALVGARRFRPGEREYIDEISAFIREQKLQDCVTIYDVQEDPYRFFVAGDILVHPSINEVLPLAICEACYCGMPVIASNLDGIPELITSEKEGLLVDPLNLDCVVDAMTRLAVSPELRARLGANARQKIAARHGEAEFISRYRSLVTKLSRVPGSPNILELV